MWVLVLVEVERLRQKTAFFDGVGYAVKKIE